MTWREIYASEWQGLWALVPLPLFFAAWFAARPVPAGGADPRLARFVHRWAAIFALQSALDPVVTGILPRSLGLADSFFATLVLLAFVLLGDFRVFLLAERVERPDAPVRRTVSRAAAWTLVVPSAAGMLHQALRSAHVPLPPTAIWLVYELCFAVLAAARGAGARAATDGATGWLRAAWAYVLVYYALWAAADALVMAAVDAGWALRILPNQLYYVFSVPALWALFFSPRYAPTSTSVQASR